MKHEWLAYAIVALLSVGAGVAIAGVPSTPPVAATIVAPATTVAPLSAVVPVVVTTEPPASTTTVTTTAEVVATTVVPASTTTTVAEPTLPDRSELEVVVANGADIGGIAGSTANDLEDLGYVDVRVTDGTDIVAFTIVYFVVDFEPSAERLAIDLGLEPTAVAPMADVPDILGDLGSERLLAYIGFDQG